MESIDNLLIDWTEISIGKFKSLTSLIESCIFHSAFNAFSGTYNFVIVPNMKISQIYWKYYK